MPACRSCNGSWSDDEAHFRTVVAIAGEANTAVNELWNTRVRAAFDSTDGQRRLRDLAEQLVPVSVEGEQRYMIYPGRDDRVMRVVKKITRGLCFHHCREVISEDRMFADVLKYVVPAEIRADAPQFHREQDIVRYQYAHFDDGDFQSVWLLTFFERTEFVAGVRRDT